MCTGRRNGEGTKQGCLTQGVQPASLQLCRHPQQTHFWAFSGLMHSFQQGPLYFLFLLKAAFSLRRAWKCLLSTQMHCIALRFVYLPIFYFVLNVEKIDVSVLVASAAHCWSAHPNTHAQSQRQSEEVPLNYICANKWQTDSVVRTKKRKRSNLHIFRLKIEKENHFQTFLSSLFSGEKNISCSL